MPENNPRAWTVLLYFAADNDLSSAAHKNYLQLFGTGSNDKVHVLAQFDRAGSFPTSRYFFKSPGIAPTKELAEVNTGKVETLLDFVFWATAPEHRADNYMLVIWGHGDGIADDENDTGASPSEAQRLRNLFRQRVAERDAEEAPAPAPATAPAGVTVVPSAPVVVASDAEFTFGGTAIDVHTQKTFASVGIDLTPDDGSGGDALTTLELQLALEIIEQTILKKKVAILGMDACLMSMAEIARQVSDHVDLVVASEEVVPTASWPYDKIISEVLADPPATPEKFSEVIIRKYVGAYNAVTQHAVTLSACKMEESRVRAFDQALAALGRTLRPLLRKRPLRRAVSKARRETLAFQFRDYIDLFHFCEVLEENLADSLFDGEDDPAARAAARAACRPLREAIAGRDGDGSGLVVHRGDNTPGEGGALRNAHGVSIFFPPLPPTYADLSLNEKTQWDSFVHAYVNAVFIPRELRLAQPAGGDLSSLNAFTASEVHPAEVGNGNGHKTLSGDQIMSNESAPAPQLSLRVLLPAGTRILNKTDGVEQTLNEQAGLMLPAGARLKVPDGTVLSLPQAGEVAVKASAGTTTKASAGTTTKAPTSGGTGTAAAQSVTLKVQACVLNKFASEDAEQVALGADSEVTTEAGKEILIIDEVEFEAEAAPPQP